MPSRRETSDMILAEARLMIESDGAAALRVTELAERCGVAIGLLYHYFNDRDGLIAAVREAQFVARIEHDSVELDSMVTSLSNAAGIMKMIIEDFFDPRHPERIKFRMDRLEALAATRHNPELKDRLTDAQSHLSQEIHRTINRAKTDGILAEDVDTKALGFLLEVIPLGTSLAQVYGDNLPDQEAWNALLLRMLRSLAAPPVPAPKSTSKKVTKK